jgi:hypothetical protein
LRPPSWFLGLFPLRRPRHDAPAVRPFPVCQFDCVRQPRFFARFPARSLRGSFLRLNYNNSIVYVNMSEQKKQKKVKIINFLQLVDICALIGLISLAGCQRKN